MASDVVGGWSLGGRLVEIVRRHGDLVVVFPDVPEEYAPRLHRRGEVLVMAGGPYDGLTVDAVERAGVDHLLIGGAITIPRWTGSPDAPVIRGLPARRQVADAETEQAYTAVLDQVRASGGGAVDLPPGVSLGDWVRWLTDRGLALFHGSSDGGLDALHPRRVSYEADDQAQRGNREAVYATDDAWWAMWFAVVDRGRLRGSMRSGVETFSGPDQRRLLVYHFSLDRRVLPSRPFRNGWLYVLPRDGFEQLPVVPGGPPSHEWCSSQVVRPLARLSVRPADFPFIDQVSAHDDGDWLRLDELQGIVRSRIAAGTNTADGVALQLSWDDSLAAIRDEFLSLSHRLMPEIAQSFDRHADGTIWLHVATAGPLVAMLQNSFADHAQQSGTG